MGRINNADSLLPRNRFKHHSQLLSRRKRLPIIHLIRRHDRTSTLNLPGDRGRDHRNRNQTNWNSLNQNKLFDATPHIRSQRLHHHADGAMEKHFLLEVYPPADTGILIPTISINVLRIHLTFQRCTHKEKYHINKKPTQNEKVKETRTPCLTAHPFIGICLRGLAYPCRPFELSVQSLAIPFAGQYRSANIMNWVGKL